MTTKTMSRRAALSALASMGDAGEAFLPMIAALRKLGGVS
jgi:hypothetical protein